MNQKPVYVHRQDGRIVRDIAIRMSLLCAGVDFQRINNLMVKYWRPETNKSALNEMQKVMEEAESAENIKTFLMKFSINLREITKDHLWARGYDGDTLLHNLDIIMRTAAEDHLL